MAVQEYQLPSWYKGAERRFSHQQRSARTSFTRRSCSHLRPMKIRPNGIQVDVGDRGRGEPSLILLHYYGWDAPADGFRSSGTRDPAICFQDLDRLGSLISFGLARNYYF